MIKPHRNPLKYQDITSKYSIISNEYDCVRDETNEIFFIEQL